MPCRFFSSGKKLRFAHQGTVKLALEFRPLTLLAARPQFFAQRHLRIALRQRDTDRLAHSFEWQTIIRESVVEIYAYPHLRSTLPVKQLGDAANQNILQRVRDGDQIPEGQSL